MILCLGDTMVDHLIFVDKYPKEGAEAIGRSELRLGGSACNTAMVLAKLGIETGLISSVGNDAEGLWTLKTLRGLNINTSYIDVSEMNTGKMTIIVSNNGLRTMYSQRPVKSIPFERKELFSEEIELPKILHVSGYVLLRDFEADFVFRQTEELKKKGCLISFDPGVSPVKKIPDLLKKFLPFVDFFFPNLDEIRNLFSSENEKDSANYALSLGVPNVIIKKGENGFSYYSNDINCDYPPLKKIISKNTTGCGDAFNAGFLAGIVNNQDIKTCGESANSCGAKIASSDIPLYEIDFL